jgi:autonomous glycyl radical cofactor GrcA
LEIRLYNKKARSFYFMNDDVALTRCIVAKANFASGDAT